MNRVLLVDDERPLLDTWKRIFFGKFEIDTAESGPLALEKMEREAAFQVVVSDFRMPQMDGATFLEQVAFRDPEAIRIMLTGNTLMDTALKAVNQGNVFRFLTKPCPSNVLEQAIRDGLRQHELVQNEREFYALKKWQEGLEGLSQALVRLVEVKDPYTAGHQHRVAELAAAMARELGGSEELVSRIALAAAIHDLGKLYAPAEFLNKPGALHPHEFAIIKLHAQIGHDILKPIRFGFPIHEIVLQHHERLDGSGYPGGLRYREILPEARIIAVADVLEAISSHRPYRPALGVEAALAEIHRGRGRTFDPEAVEAAERLFLQQGFFFGSAGGAGIPEPAVGGHA